MTTYTFSIKNNFPNHIMNSDQLTIEITTANLTSSQLDHITTWDDDCNLVFTTDLSSTDQTTLNSVVAAHQGTPPTANNAKVNITMPDGTVYTDVIVHSGS